MEIKASGIDVSSFQGNINWTKVKNAGIDFAIIRAGWGKSGVDPKFKTNIQNAVSAGIRNIGIYWFIYAYTEQDVIQNAISCDNLIKQYKDNINFKVWCDWEYDSDSYYQKHFGKTLDKTTRTKWVKTWCEKIKSLGYNVGIYANPDYINNKFNSIVEYPLWLAYYTTSMGKYESYSPMLWQYSSKGKIDGISGNVDCNYYYGNEIRENITTKQETTTTTTVGTYKVVAGDTMSKIAKKYNTSLANLSKLNPQITNINKIDVGQIINIPTNAINNSNPYKEPILILKKGSSGEGVKWVQWQLRNVLGYSDVAVDGVFGAITDKRVREAQKLGKVTVDGKVGVNTRRVLK